MKFFSAAALAVASSVVSAGQALAIDYDPPFPPFVAIGGETRLIYPSVPVELLVTEAESGGQFGMVVSYHKPNEGTPDRILLEPKLTETFYVIEGRYRFSVGDDTYEGGPGTVVVNPPKVPHGFTNIGNDIGKLLVIYTPVDASPMKGTDFFVQWARQSTRSPEWIAKTNAAYGIVRPTP